MKPIDPALQEQLDAHAARNRALLAELERLGHSAEEEQDVEFYFLAEALAAAESLAAELAGLGYVTDLHESDASDESSWSLSAAGRLTLREAASQALTRDLIALATRHGAHFDGWGASV